MNYRDSIYLNDNETATFELNAPVETVMAYRVPEDAEKGLFLFESYDKSTVTIKAADHVFGGKDLVVDIEENYCVLYLDINAYIQRTGEYKGCIVVENSDESAMCEFIILE